MTLLVALSLKAGTFRIERTMNLQSAIDLARSGDTLLLDEGIFTAEPNPLSKTSVEIARNTRLQWWLREVFSLRVNR